MKCTRCYCCTGCIETGDNATSGALPAGRLFNDGSIPLWMGV
jgi:hypothetical protein